MVLLLGKKIGMTQVYDESGRLLPVTVIQAGPCVVMQVKTIETDGYNAIQMGYDDIKSSVRNKPQLGIAEKANTVPKRFTREMRLPNDTKPEHKAGDSITVASFTEKGLVDVIGTSKGKGFEGVMKRYHFGGMPDSHSTERKHRNSIIAVKKTFGMKNRKVSLYPCINFALLHRPFPFNLDSRLISTKH
jgi:large subunit ribosomal protein L3